jgi:hypothetical protein
MRCPILYLASAGLAQFISSQKVRNIYLACGTEDSLNHESYIGEATMKE